MFPFGSITSIIPLFILAFAYVVYFSASFLNKSNHTGHIEAAEGKVIVEYGTNNEFSDKYPDFRHVYDNGSDDFIGINDEICFKNTTCIFFHEVSYISLFPPHRISAFSPRPPPAV